MSDTLDKNHWKHFTFIKKKNEITLLRYPADPILEYRDKKDSSKFKYVCVRNGDSKETDGFMKVHKGILSFMPNVIIQNLTHLYVLTYLLVYQYLTLRCD